VTGRLNVLLVADAVSLPSGMASTQRLTGLARGLLDAGAAVRIALLRPTEAEPGGANRAAAGAVHGIPFEYTCGTSAVARTRLGRRRAELVGCWRALRLIASLRRACRGRGEPLRVVAYSRHLSTIAPVACLCRLLGVPLVAEMCEWPVTQPDPMTLGRFRRRAFCRWVARLVDGAVPISRYIEARLAQPPHGRPALRQCRIPILVDAQEPGAVSGRPPASSDYVLFGGSAAYRKTIAFVLDAMELLKDRYPETALVMTGIDLSKQAWLARAIGEHNLEGRVLCTGFLSRADLLCAYRGARALLIPLFDDDQSRARFPTKLAEYLLSGRPVVSSRVGEVPYYLRDGQEAFLADPGSREAFAGALSRALDQPEHAGRAAARGREVARREFDYREHGRRLKTWLEEEFV
jgi:glycosyltransferase involved in cell wall biosynthesis